LENSNYDQAIDRRMGNPVSIGLKHAAVFPLFLVKQKKRGIEQIRNISGLSIKIRKMR
jgi:hypothetical protein